MNVIATYDFCEEILSDHGAQFILAIEKTNPNNQVTIKIMKKEGELSKQFYQREISILNRLIPDINNAPPGILQYIGHGEDDDNYYIISRAFTGGDLFDRIVTKKHTLKLTEDKSRELMKQMLNAVKYCHDNDVTCRDCKPEAWAFKNKSPDSDIIIINFTAAKIVEDDDIVKDSVATLNYLAPELAVCKLKEDIPYNPTGKILKQSDAWIMGVIAYTMLTGEAPFQGNTERQQLEAICNEPLLFPKYDATYNTKLKLSEPFRDFVTKLLIKDPESRMTIKCALRHPWIQGIAAGDFRLNRDVMHYLRQYKYQPAIKIAITNVLAANMSAEPSQNIQRYFKRVGAEENGYLDEADLTTLLLAVGEAEYVAKEEAQRIIEHADMNGDGLIDLLEFKQIWYRKVLASNDTYVNRVFEVFDDNGDGFIDVKEFGSVLFPEKYNEDGEFLKKDEEMDEDTMKLIDEIDLDQDGRISFDEFKAAMREDWETQRRNAVDLINGYIREFTNNKQGISIPIEINPIITRYYACACIKL